MQINGRWGGKISKGEGRKCKIYRKMLLHSDMLKLCLKENQDISILFPDTIMFLDEKNSHYKVTGYNF